MTRRLCAILFASVIFGASSVSAAPVRHLTDQVDDSALQQVHIVYAVPSDGVDRHLDTNGALNVAAQSLNAWLGDHSGRQVRFDTAAGELDVSFLRLSMSTETVRTTSNAALPTALLADLAAAGFFNTARKVYAVYYDGPNASTCGLSRFNGGLAIVFLQACGDVVQQWDLVMLHEVLHALGAVPSNAPHVTPDSHVNDDPNDLMVATGVGPNPNLDLDHQDYFGHGRPSGFDLATSPYFQAAIAFDPQTCHPVPVDASFTAGASGGVSSTFVLAPRSCSWFIQATDASSWLTASSNGAIGPGRFTLTVARNVTPIAHQATVRVFSPTGTTESISVSQSAGPALLTVIDAPRTGATIRSDFVVAGWAFDRSGASSASSSVRLIDVWAMPDAVGAPNIYLGSAQLGIARPDVSAALLDPRGDRAGFALQVPVAKLPPGGYTIAVFPFDDVSAEFEGASIVHVTVALPVSDPLMYIDQPTSGSVLSVNGFTVAGWAVDRAATTGAGVDAVHVWAYPTNGAPAILVGVASMGFLRQDVATFIGRASAAPCGFGVSGTLPAGSYNLVVFAHSSVTGTFNNVSVLPITVK